MSSATNFGVPLPSGRAQMKQPKPKYRFRVMFFGFGATSDGDYVSIDTNKCGSPSLKAETPAVHSYNSVAYYKAKPEWETIDLSVRDSVGNQALKSIWNQLRREFNVYTQESRTSASQFKFELWIQALDGSDSQSTGLYGGTLHTWVCQGCQIADFKSGDFDYGSSEMVELDITIRPDVCFLLDENGKPIGDAVTGNGTASNSTAITATQSTFDTSAIQDSNFYNG